MKIKNTTYSWRKTILFSATFFCTVIALVSCKKETSTLGSSVYEDLLASGGTDTFNLNTYTIQVDSIRTTNPLFATLGSYNDPKFGSVKAGFYTQLRLGTLSPIFDVTAPDFTIDSLVLGLEYRTSTDFDFKNYYGKTDAQTFEVYRLEESIYVDSSYYQFTSKTTGNENLVRTGMETITPRPSTRTIVGTDTLSPQLRIHLKTSFAQQLIDETINNPSSYTSNENFLSFLKGLYVKTNNTTQTSGQGGVFNFNLNAANSKMTIYLRQNGQQFSYDYVINSNCARFNQVQVNNAGTNVQQVIDNVSLGNKEFYAQTFRSRAVIEMPTIGNIPKTSVINKALLILPVSYQTGKIYYPSEVLRVFYRPTIESNLYNDLGVFGSYDDNLKAYVIDVRDYVQDIVKEKYPNRGIYLTPFFLSSAVERIIFNGKNTDFKKKPKLVVSYTSY